MDMITTQALRVVLQEAECDILEKVRLDLERSRMTVEDLAVRGTIGRFIMNRDLEHEDVLYDSIGDPRDKSWCALLEYWRDSYFALEQDNIGRPRTVQES